MGCDYKFIPFSSGSVDSSLSVTPSVPSVPSPLVLFCTSPSWCLRVSAFLQNFSTTPTGTVYYNFPTHCLVSYLVKESDLSPTTGTFLIRSRCHTFFQTNLFSTCLSPLLVHRCHSYRLKKVLTLGHPSLFSHFYSSLPKINVKKKIFIHCL